MEKNRINGTVIKWIVIVAMIVDHAAWAFLPTNSIGAMLCHTFGRLTGPTMFYFLVEGYHHTRNLKKYIVRMAVFALISHLPYNIWTNYGKIAGPWSSVGTTLFCALIALLVLEKVKNPVLKWMIIILLAGLTFWSDWAVWGVIFVIGFGLFYGDRKKQWIAFGIINIVKIIYTYFFICGPNPYRLTPAIVGPVLVFVMFRFYDGTRGNSKFAKVSKWAFYIIYPLQFAVLGLIYLSIN